MHGEAPSKLWMGLQRDSVLHTEDFSCFSLVPIWRKNHSSNEKVVFIVLQLVESWDQEMRARLLQFVTGTSKV